MGGLGLSGVWSFVFFDGLGGSGFTAFWPGFYSFFARVENGFLVVVSALC